MDGRDNQVVTWLLAVAALAWLLATISYGQLEEPDQHDAASGSKPGFLDRLALLREQPEFRRFVITRALLMSSALVAPYYILLASRDDNSIGVLGLLLLASGVASLLSAPFWGRFADLSSRQVMMCAGTIVAVLGAVTLAIGLITPAWLQAMWVLPFLYLLLEVAHNGVRVGRKTYVVDLADDSTRVDYVSVGNTVIGALLLLVGLIGGALAALLPTLAIIGLFSVLSLGGVLLSLALPEVE